MSGVLEITAIIVSIQPKFCKAIYSKEKIVELRRRIGQKFVVGARMYIYTSKVGRGVSGEVVIKMIELLSLEEIKQKYINYACISVKDFDTYYDGCAEGYVISLSEVTEYKRLIPLKELQNLGFHAPQSFMYASHQIEEYIEATKCI